MSPVSVVDWSQVLLDLLDFLCQTLVVQNFRFQVVLTHDLEDHILWQPALDVVIRVCVNPRCCPSGSAVLFTSGRTTILVQILAR